MSEHKRKVYRMLAVQQQLHRIEEWRLAELRARLEELTSDQKALIAALNEDDALQGLFIDSMARRLRSLFEAASATSKDTQLQAVKLLEQASRLICAERLARSADLQDQRASEKRDLAEAIERLGDAQASRKIAG